MVTIPTLSQLKQSVIDHLETEMNITVPLFGKSFLLALANVMAGKLKVLYLGIASVQKNIFVDTAEPPSMGGTLYRFGMIKLGRLPFPATAGQYTVEVTGTIGAIIPARTTFKSDDDSTSPSKLFILDEAFELETTTDHITLRALEAGLDSSLNIGDTLTSTTPIALVDKGAEVTAITVDPLSAETDEEYRAKAIEAYRLEPQGGAATDYRLWCNDVQGVAKVYPYPTAGEEGSITLYVEATIDDSTDGKGTPSSTILDDVEEVIELDPDTTKPINERGRRPLGVFEVDVLAVTIKEIDIEIIDFEDLTDAKEAAIELAIEELLASVRPFIAGADLVADRNDVLNLNKIIYAIQQAVPGCIFASVEMDVDGAYDTSYTFTAGEIPNLQSVTHV